MQDNVLKKEFSPQDVQRVRNLVQGKYGEKVTAGVGYTKKEDMQNTRLDPGISQNTRLDPGISRFCQHFALL